MTVTTAFDAKQSLVDGLSALPELADLAADGAIWYGYSGRSGDRPRECVWVGEIAWEDEHGVAIGGRHRDEEYRIVLTVESHVPGDTQQEANARVKARLAPIEAFLRDVRCLHVPGIYEVGIVPQLLGEGADPGGRGALVVLAVRIRARI